MLKNELTSIEESEEVEDHFYQYLEFGTGGMRGELGVGTNRINHYTIMRVALSLAIYIDEKGLEAKKSGVVISYDNRLFSKEFAKISAKVLASKKIKVYLSDRMRPTPELSFLVRKLEATAGIMITASHNPKEYNGFKVYDSDGGQITLETANILMEILDGITNELEIQTDSLEDYIHNGLVAYLGRESDKWYLEQLDRVSQQKKILHEYGNLLSISYTPLHGTGEYLICNGLKQSGFSNINILKEQADGDPEFSSLSVPNPEDPQAFELLLESNKNKQIDLFLATDPDADRLGVMIRDNLGNPVLLTGNQIGLLLLDYLIQNKDKTSLSHYFIVKTIVTSDLGKKIATKNGIETRETLTGFKFIGEQIKEAEKKQDKTFLFGYEESFGYLVLPFVRDKDAIQAALLMAELTLIYKMDGKTLLDRLNELYQEYGFYKETLESIEFKGKDGQQKLSELMDELRSKQIIKLNSFNLKSVEDYLISQKIDISNNKIEKLHLPKTNVLKFIFDNDDWICIRPSGTEPKCKIYYSVNDTSEDKASKKMEVLKKEFHNLLESIKMNIGI